VKRRQQLLEAGRLARERAAVRRAQLAKMKVRLGKGGPWSHVSQALSREHIEGALRVVVMHAAFC
jgi:hypothetical protein